MNNKQHLLVCLSEECAEVIHAASKCLRFSPEDKHPLKASTNIEDLKLELNDLISVIQMLQEVFPEELTFDKSHIAFKKEKVLHYMDYARTIGVLDPE